MYATDLAWKNPARQHLLFKLKKVLNPYQKESEAGGEGARGITAARLPFQAVKSEGKNEPSQKRRLPEERKKSMGNRARLVCLSIVFCGNKRKTPWLYFLYAKSLFPLGTVLVSSFPEGTATCI
jgi:hypothetical protein